MLELTPENTVSYLRERHWVGSGPVRVELLAGGVSNAVFRVEEPERRFVLKQSRPQLRTRDAWFSDLDRVYREQEVMEALFPFLPAPTVPEILFADRENYVFAMSHAPIESRVWKEMLLANQVDLAIGEHSGVILGRMHEVSAREPERFERFHDHTVFVQLRADPFYKRVQERRPEVAREVAAIEAQMLATKEALCHADYSPKNILVHGSSFTLVDYETAHIGDPTMDLGFFLSHLMLKSARPAAPRARFFELTRAFWRGYAGEVRYRPVAELEARAAGHFAVCLLARIDGTSPIDYLREEPAREAVRRLARRVLRERPGRWSEILNIADQELQNS